MFISISNQHILKTHFGILHFFLSTSISYQYKNLPFRSSELKWLTMKQLTFFFNVIGILIPLNPSLKCYGKWYLSSVSAIFQLYCGYLTLFGGGGSHTAIGNRPMKSIPTVRCLETLMLEVTIGAWTNVRGVEACGKNLFTSEKHKKGKKDNNISTQIFVNFSCFSVDYRKG